MSVTEDSVNDFKKIKTYPTVDDIKRQKVPKISKNKIHESYQNTDHYLKTQFELLREEFVRPLIDDIKTLKQLFKEFNKEIQKVKKDYQNVVESIKMDNNVAIDLNESKEENTTNRIKEQMKEFQKKVDKGMDSNVFFDIKLIEPFIDFNINYGTLLKFTFDYQSLEKTDLIDCQPLMSGGILCLSPTNDFFEKSIVFGVIASTQFRQIDSNGKEKDWSFSLKLDLDTNGAQEFCQFLLNPNITYIGVESPSYYEGFRYTLKNLQNIPQNFPFKRYIVDNKTDIKSPEYLTNELIYDMSCVESKNTENLDQNIESVENSKERPLSSVRLQSNDVFGKDKSLYNRGIDLLKKGSTFDTKQFDAFYAALSKELCLIEGPPGTGKTFVGLRIVECLLKNRQMWDQSNDIQPILIVCFKNHALDQFLEGIIKFNRNVIRIGMKSESEKLDEFKLGKLEYDFPELLKNSFEIQKLNSEKLMNEINDRDNEEDNEETVNKDNKQKDNNKRKLLDPELIRKYKVCKKIKSRIHAIHRSAEYLVEKVVESFEKILEFEDIKPFIKRKLAENIEKNFVDLKEWLNPENDPKFEEICRKKLKQKRLPEYKFDEIINKKDIFDMEINDKWLLYLYWREKLFDKTLKELNENFETSFEEIKKFMNKRVVFQRQLCKGAEVIGLTITGASKYKDLVKAFNPKIMIVEEAAEVLEGHVVSAFPSELEHLILIGDHKQLRPLTNVQELTDNYFLDISLFERLVKNKQPFIQLELQHRMRPSISELLKVGNIYDNLRNGQKVLEYEDMKYTFNKNIYFIDHQNIEDSNFCRDVPDKSRSNLHEAKYVLQLVKYFLLRNYSEEKITVLAAYNAQTSLIKKLMFDQKGVFVKEVKNEKPNKKLTKPKEMDKPEEELTVRVSSIDGFQGEENDIIIISFVRSSKRNSIGFLEVKNRVNVALSRARHALFCVGNFTIMAKEAKTDMWAPIKQHLSKNKCFGEEFTIGCECTGEFHISMPGQLELLNLQLENGRCNGRCNGPNSG